MGATSSFCLSLYEAGITPAEYAREQRRFDARPRDPLECEFCHTIAPSVMVATFADGRVHQACIDALACDARIRERARQMEATR